MTSIHSVPHEGNTPHRLPTRVRTACERCRHHKSRCDNARPCLLCVRAGVDCRPLPTNRTPTSRARKLHIRKNSATRQNEPQPPSHRSELMRNGRGYANSPSDRPRSTESPTGADRAEPVTAMGILSPPTHCDEAQSALGIAQRIFELSSQHIDEQTTSAIPGYHAGINSNNNVAVTVNSEHGQRRSISSILGGPFPPMDLVFDLLEDYFDAIHWFSLAIYEPKFRKLLNSIADGSANPSQRPFILLLSVMLGMATWYRSQRSGTDLTENSDQWRVWSTDLLKVVESNLVEVMDRPSITAIQTCVLLGSHHVYHGRPNLAFSLLGATIKMSQSLGLHRHSSRGTTEDIEEKKRIWWTIYTWDRFASIAYGRPLGISDKDCDVEMPADLPENPNFVSSTSDPSSFITYSPYQRELNRLYLIASPALKEVFGSRTTGTSDQLTGDAYYELAREATQNLQAWSLSLPSHLSLDLEQDFRPDADLRSRAHALQSLSLQLTYDNVLIVLHRPLLNRQVDYLSTKNQAVVGVQNNSPSEHPGTSVPFIGSSLSFEPMNPRAQDSSQLWMNAAVRTSRVTELPVLAQLATDSHLVAFLAINLFNAAIVLAVMALSEPLSDMAQDIKRTITRILRLQDLLGKRSALSKQSTTVLKNVVILLLHRESAAIFAPISGTNQRPRTETQSNPTYNDLMSVEDTLRLPLNTTLDSRHQPTGHQSWPPPSRADRLNESLTSVQHVFGTGNDGQSNQPGTEIPIPTQRPFPDDGIQPQSNLQLPAGYDWNMFSIPEDPNQGSSYGNMDDGLCWLWDTTWNGFERQ